MEVKNLFDPLVKEVIIDRINCLTAQSQRQWGKMDAGQMLNHCRLPIAMAMGNHEVKGSFMLRLIGPMFKSMLYNEKPYKQGLPTDKTYIVGESKNFDEEKSQLIDNINKFTPESITVQKHPVFGKFTAEQWGKSTWKHLDHHLRQFGV